MSSLMLFNLYKVKGEIGDNDINYVITFPVLSFSEFFLSGIAKEEKDVPGESVKIENGK